MKQRTSQLVLQVSLKAVVLAVLLGLLTPHLFGAPCSGLPTEAQLKTFLAKAAAGTGISASLGPGTGVGGIFSGKLMWAAVVDRNGVICAYVTSTSDPTQVWPGSQQIAKAKAYTANAFSVSSLALSTARLYTFVQPSHSLFGLNDSNPFNTLFLAPPSGNGGGKNQLTGGITLCLVPSSAGWESVVIQLAPTMKSPSASATSLGSTLLAGRWWTISPIHRWMAPRCSPILCV